MPRRRGSRGYFRYPAVSLGTLRGEAEVDILPQCFVASLAKMELGKRATKARKRNCSRKNFLGVLAFSRHRTNTCQPAFCFLCSHSSPTDRHIVLSVMCSE